MNPTERGNWVRKWFLSELLKRFWEEKYHGFEPKRAGEPLKIITRRRV